MHRNVWVLLAAGAFGLCVAPVMVFVGGIVGSLLAPHEGLATVPVACLVVGTALGVLPVSRLMQKLGRKRVFLFGAVYSALVALAAAYSIAIQSFYLFSISSVLLGAALSVIQQYRFAAMESVDFQVAPKAASLVLMGGLVAAVLGPELALVGKTMLNTDFVGSFVCLSLVSLLSTFILFFYQDLAQEQEVVEACEARGMKEISGNILFWLAIGASTVGYAVMSYIMTATPVSMHVMMTHSLEETKWVIQSHILAMFLPSLFSAYLIAKLGVYRLMFIGLVIYSVCLLIALSGQAVMHYWYSLVLLGLGWNFLFVSGTVLLPQSYRQSERFKVQGFHDSFVFVFQAIASIMSGVVIYHFGWNQLIVFAVPLVLVQYFLLVSWRFKRVPEGVIELEASKKH